MKRILIVEDEESILRALKDTFHSNGYEVLAATDGEEGQRLALDAQVDIVLLDIMLPKVNGFEICRAIRAAGVDVPIIMLTAKGQEEDVVLGLNLGADDYVVKPFKMRELVARVNAFLRRRSGPPEDIIRFGGHQLDLTAHKLFRGADEVPLTTKEFNLLAYLASRPGRALTRDDILNRVWGHSVIVTPRSIDRFVTTLRAKIESDPHHPRFIQTIRDIGYR
ncbi:MAG TPA: response regulator transcription factor, partial [Bryobacteraceae bacterium]